MKTSSLNRQLATGHRLALALEPKLAAVYAAQFRQIARYAATRFSQLAVPRPVTAAAGDGTDNPDWVPPDVDELLNQPLADAKAEDAATPIHLQAINLATPAPIKGVGVSFDVDSPFAKPLLEAVGTKSVNLGLAARDVILKVIGDSYAAGLSVPNTAALLQEQIAHLSDTTALMQARTDLNGLANGASLQSVQLLGDEGPATKMWLATEDERTRETHADADGQEVPTDQPFQVGDDLLMYPGDPDGSDAEVINCRCTVVYSDGQPNPNQEDDVTASATTTEEPLATSGCANCSHAFSDHLGAAGPCTMADCSCNGWEAMTAAATYQPPEIGVLTAAAGDPIPWRAVLIVEGEETADGRIIDVGAIDWRPLPLTLMAMTVTDEGHDGAEVAGRIDNIYRDPLMFDDGRVAIVGEGIFDTGDYGAEIARLVGDETLRGVSADLGNVEIQLRPRNAPTYDVGDQEFDSDYDEAPEQALEPEEMLVAYVQGTLLGATVCPFPAIGSGAIEISDATIVASYGDGWIIRVLGAGLDKIEQPGLTAAAAGATLEAPPAAWFDDPRLEEPTPLTIDDDGRVFGHVAPWNVCHIGNPSGPNVCVTAPRDQTGYAMFHLGELRTAEGEAISVGQVTLDTDHAPLGLSAQASQRHYADTGAAACYGRCGMDQFGIWFAGALADDLPVSKIRKLRAAKLSGDWRRIDGRVEMIGVLAVNVPGFPIPRPAAQIRASGEILALVAAGIYGETPPTEEQARARIAALAARALGREELLRLALGDDDEALTAAGVEITIRVDDGEQAAPVLMRRPEMAVGTSNGTGAQGRGQLETVTVDDNYDREIGLQADYVRDHGYYSEARLSGHDLTRAQLAAAQNAASMLITAPDAPESILLRARLVSKGLLL